MRRVAVVIALCALVACAEDDSGMPRADRGDGVAKLRWQAPTVNEDGTPLTDLAAFHVRYGRSADDLRYSLRIGDPQQTSAVVTGLGSGKWYFTVVAVNNRGKASTVTDVVSKDVD